MRAGGKEDSGGAQVGEGEGEAEGRGLRMFKTGAEEYRRDRAPWLGRIRDRGFQARCQGVSRDQNPYGLTWVDAGAMYNRARWRAWDSGWEAGDIRLREVLKPMVPDPDAGEPVDPEGDGGCSGEGADDQGS